MRLLVNLVVIATTVAIAFARPQLERQESFEILSNGCPVNWDIHHLLPHESDCRLFYYCVRGEKVLRECSPGTHFDTTEQVCDWPENVGCQLAGGEDDSLEYEGSGDPDIDGGGDEEDTLANGCPADFEVHKLLAHETECNLFYYCVFGEKVLRECAPGTYFNYDIQVCDWPENVECASAGGGDGVGGEQLPATEGPGDGGVENPGGETLDNGCPADWDEHRLLPHEYDCSLFYYCVHGNRVLRECAPGTHFNPTLQVCDWPENAGCGSGGGNTESPGAGSGEDNNVTEGPGNGSGEDNDVTEGPGNDSGEDDTATDIPGNGSGENPGNESGEWLENGCPADWDVHHLLPHESDCSSFYYCVHGELVARECPPGLHFNAVEQVCDWPDNAGCENGGGNTDSPGNGSEEENNVTDNPGNGSEEIPDSGSGEWLANGCPADWDVHHLLPHESDCTQFYYCVHGNLVARECPPGLHFNSVEQVCDWPENAGCDNGGGNTDSPGNGSEEENNVTDSPGNGSEEIPDSGSGEWLANGCPADWDVHHLLPHESDCTQFYYCVHGNLVARECPPGLHFNSVEQVCDWPENAGCENSGGNTDNPGTGSEEENNVTDGPSNGSEEDNDVTDNPGNGGEEDNNVTESPENGSEEDNNVTDSPGNGSEEIPEVGSGEWLENGCPADWNVHHLLPHENDCTQFYYCVHGELVARECSPGLHFNPVEQVCDWPDNAGCENGGGNTDSPGNVTEEDNDVTDSPGNGSQETPGAESAEWLENGCPADWSIHHLLPHETDCTKFYYCVRGELVERECAPGLHFNPTIQVCDWPDNAGCANGGGSNEISESSSEENNAVTDGPENGSAESAEWLENGCPADWSIHHLLPHETDCTKFYYCVHGELVERECAPGLHFNPTIQVCDWPDNAGCANGGGSNEISDSSSEENNEVTDGPASGSEENNEVTDGPASGSEENNEVTDGPASGSEENNDVTDGPGNNSEENNGVTEGPGNGSAESAEWLDNGCPADWTIHHLLPHETECTKFYYCVHGDLVLSECSGGLHFNPILQVCDWPENAGCQSDGGNTEAPGNESGEDNNVTDSPVDSGEEETEGPATEAPGNGSGEDSEEGSGSGSEEETGSPQDDICANECHVAHWAHETDCDKFWKCKDGKAVLGVCSEGLHFNREEQTCDFICNVNCVRETIQATVGETGLKLFVPWDKIDDKLLSAYKLLEL